MQADGDGRIKDWRVAAMGPERKRIKRGEQTFDLMELGQVGAIYGFVAKDTVNGEILCRLETLLCQVVQHARGNGGGVCS